MSVELALADHLARELRELRLLDGALARLPEDFGLRWLQMAPCSSVRILGGDYIARGARRSSAVSIAWPKPTPSRACARCSRSGRRAIEATALRLAQRVRATPPGPLSAESFLRHYGLSTPEGVALMCVAEALLRIPDAPTADALLREKLSQGDWRRAATTRSSPAPRTGRCFSPASSRAGTTSPSPLKHIVARLGEPVVRAAVRQAMRILAEQFVLAETIEDAVRRGAERAALPFIPTTCWARRRARREDAAHYMELYTHAIGNVRAPDTISIKLSALHPRFEEAKRARVFAELLPRLRSPGAAGHQRAASASRSTPRSPSASS